MEPQGKYATQLATHPAGWCGGEAETFFSLLPGHAKRRLGHGATRKSAGLPKFVGEESFRNALPVCMVAAPSKVFAEAKCPVCCDSLHGQDEANGRLHEDVVSVAHDAPGHANACHMTLGRGGCHFTCFAEMAKRNLLSPCGLPSGQDKDVFKCLMCRRVVSAKHLLLVRM